MKHNSTAKEQSLHPTSIGCSPLKSTPKPAVERFDERVRTALQGASDKKGIDSVLLDLREIASFTDYFVITSGSNERQVQAIADEIVEQLKKSGTAAARVEGYKSAEWILLDYGDFIVHVFAQKARKFYDLERLWRDAKRIELPGDLSGENDSSLRKEL